MNRRKAVSAWTVLAVLLAATTAGAGTYNEVVSIGDSLPEFENLPAIDGSQLSSKDLETEIIVLVFLANHCPWVRGMNADLVEFVGALPQEKVQVVGVSVNHIDADRLPAMKDHAEKYGYNFTYVYDESQELGRALGATRTPEYFVFGRDRNLAYTGLLHNSPAMERQDGTISYTQGEPSEFYALDAVMALIDGKPVAVTETRAHGCSVKYE